MSERNAKSKSPAIRFQGFSGEWVESDLHLVVDVRSGRDYKHLSTGEVPVFGTGGYMLSVNEALSYNEDAIGIGRKGTIDKPYILKAPFWTVDTLFYAVPYVKNNLDFVFAIFQKINWRQKDESTGVPSLSKVAINSISVFTTGTKEQTQIGNFFQQLDRLIAQHQQKHDKLLSVKKALLEKMFPKQGETQPAIRFKGFSEPWEEKALGDVGSFISGTGFSEAEQGGEAGIPFFKVSDMNLKDNQRDMVSSNNYVNDEQIVRLNYKPIKTKSIIFAKVGAAIFLERKRTAINFLIDNNMMAFLPTEDVDFVKQWFDSISLSKYIQVGALPSYNASDLKIINFNLPLRQEQTKIGKFFQQLDSLISQQQSQLTKLANIKQAMLAKMFV